MSLGVHLEYRVLIWKERRRFMKMLPGPEGCGCRKMQLRYLEMCSVRWERTEAIRTAGTPVVDFGKEIEMGSTGLGNYTIGSIEVRFQEVITPLKQSPPRYFSPANAGDVAPVSLPPPVPPV